MKISLITWNINSVRLRMPLLEQLAGALDPDVICLQETKCPDGKFPSSAIRKLGYDHMAINGQSGYHGVAILSRIPLTNIDKKSFCDMGDSRHVSADLALSAPAQSPIRVHNFYVPAGGDVPDPAENPKFAHKLGFLNEMESWFLDKKAGHIDRMVLVGDLNIAPFEHDVWSHKQLLKVVSHTPVEVEHLEKVRLSRGWVDLMRDHVAHDEKLYTWWSYRARDWSAADKGRRLDHVWVSPALSDFAGETRVIRDARGWERPSDHAPVLYRFET